MTARLWHYLPISVNDRVILPFNEDYIFNHTLYLELLENLILVINSKILSNFIKKKDITLISCDSLHAWL